MKHVFDYLDETMSEFFEERAGIMHHCGGLPKERAEALAKAETETYRAMREKAAKDSQVNK